MISTDLRLRLSALQGDPGFRLGPRRKSAAVPQPGLSSPPGFLGGLADLGFGWDEERGILLRRARIPLEKAGLVPARLQWPSLSPISSSVPRTGPLSLLCFDLETTGLQRGAGTVPFLYGWASYREGATAVLVEQWLLPELGEEAPLVRAALGELAQASLLVTYNGSSYDLPLLRTRMVMTGVDRAWPAVPHLDLLPVVRRLFRHRLERCTLRAVEEALLDEHRDHDLPGREAPERYWHFLETRDCGPLLEVVRHNQQDVVSLLAVLQRLGRHLDCDGPAPTDWLSLGRFVESRGDLAAARTAYERAETLSPPPLDRAAVLRRARMLKREGRIDEATKAWRSAWERWRDPEAAEALCVDLEHRLREPALALELARDALREASTGWDQRFARRIWRLSSKLGRGGAPATDERALRTLSEPERPWATWLPGGESYEAWLALHRGRGAGEGATARTRGVTRAS